MSPNPSLDGWTTLKLSMYPKNVQLRMWGTRNILLGSVMMGGPPIKTVLGSEFK